MFLALVFAVNNVAEQSRDSVFMPVFTDEVKQRKRQTRIKPVRRVWRLLFFKDIPTQ